MRRIFRQSWTWPWRFWQGPPQHAAQKLKQSWSILYWLPTGIVLTQYFYTIKFITGRSMQVCCHRVFLVPSFLLPTLNPDSSLWRDIAVFDRYSVHTLHQYNRGDVVALKSPENPKHMLVKRIIAMEGDLVQTLPPYPDLEVRVPQGHVWIEGDEPFHSSDSNTFGPVPLALIDCKLLFILWPLRRFGPLHRSITNAKSGYVSRNDEAVANGRRWWKSRVTVAQEPDAS